jgi:hypothetical protein
MRTAKFIINFILIAIILFVQVGGVFAASATPSSTPVIGTIQSITLETDATTGITIVILDLIDNQQIAQRVRISQETAITLGIVVLNGDGKPGINNVALGKPIEIASADVLPAQEENQHPVGSALATFFSDIAGINYASIMEAHDQGMGFGTIAQTLWLTKKLEGNAEVFETLLNAKQTGDYSGFILADGSIPQNWGQLKKAILANNGNNGVGVVMSDSNENGGGNDKEKEKNGNGNGNGSGNGNGNGNNSDKDKDKDKKDKDKP